MKIAHTCTNCGHIDTVPVMTCARCKRTSDVYYPAKPNTPYSGQLLCPSCYGSPEVNTPKAGPRETN